MSSHGFLGAVFLKATNRERKAINDAMGRHFAMTRGVPIVKWANAIAGTNANNLTDDSAELLVHSVPELQSTFIQDSPAMLLYNVKPVLGMSNGSLCTMVALSGLNSNDEDRIRQADTGEVVWLTEPPKYVVIELNDANSLKPKLLQELGGSCHLAFEERTSKMKFGNRKVYRWHFVDLAFALTMHKVQGKTLRRVVLCLDKCDGSKITFDQLLVALTRVNV